MPTAKQSFFPKTFQQMKQDVTKKQAFLSSNKTLQDQTDKLTHLFVLFYID